MLVDADGNELVKKNVTKSLEFGDRAIVDLEWKPTAEMAIYGKIVTFQGDDNLDNNISDALTIQPRADYDGSLVPSPQVLQQADGTLPSVSTPSMALHRPSTALRRSATPTHALTA